MTTTGGRDRRPIGLPLVILQMAVSAIAFMIVLVIMALVMPLWQLGKRLISYGRRTMQRYPVASVVVVERGDMRTDKLRESRKTYHRVLRHLLTEDVQRSFKEQHERPTPRIAELLRQLDQTAPMQSFAR
jgi:hypothetical protein